MALAVKHDVQALAPAELAHSH